jgi:hypothetical protein
MTRQTNPDSPTTHPDGSPEDSPSQNDLMALVPDMELLETSTIDARAAHSAMAAAAGSGRKQGPAPKLTDRHTATTVRIAAPQASVNDDPYAHLMPELESFEAPTASVRAIPDANFQVPAPIATPNQAAPPARPAPAPAAPRPPAAPPPPRTPAPARAAAPAVARKMPNPESVAVPPVMDREFIARNRIVELYVSGALPVRGATVFEQFCRQNPQILDEIGLPERVHTALRLLEASGKPEPWQEKPKQFWERPYVPTALSGLVLVLGFAILMLNRQLSDQTRKVADLHQLVIDQPIEAATATSTVTIQPTHVGPKAVIDTVIGGSAAQMVNIKIDMTHSDFRAFRVTIDRMGEGRVEVLNNLIKNSNGELGFSLNTSALGAGTYPLTIEGLDWRGDPQQDSWAALTVRH